MRAPRSTWKRHAAVAAPVLALVTALMYAAFGPAVDAESGLDMVRYEPDDAVPRLTAPWFDVSGVAMIADFELTTDRLYLLDQMNYQVLVLPRSQMVVAHTFGRAGDGPLEFRMPRGIAANSDESALLITEEARVHIASADGRPIAAHTLNSPCAGTKPRPHTARDGWFVTINCVGASGYDTMFSTLLWTENGENYREVARDIQVTSDGFGSGFSPDHQVATGADYALYSAGVEPCVHTLRFDGGVPAATRSCSAVDRYRAQPDPEGEERNRQYRQRYPQAAHLFRSVTALPTYWAQVRTSAGDMVFRPFTTDSMVVRRAGSDEDLLVVSLNGFEGCRRRGCLWHETTRDGARVRILATEELADLAAGGRQ